MAKKVLLIVAHPKLEKSHAHARLLEAVKELSWLHLHDLYEHYPDFNVDVAKEQALLSAHDLIVWQHPVYWYSCPPLLKQWIDLVLTIGWAYGAGGNALQGKWLLQAVSSGGSRQVYQPEGRNKHTLRQFFVPFSQTAQLCKMHYLPPFAVQGTHQLSADDFSAYAALYSSLLTKLANEPLDASTLDELELLNDWVI